MAGSGVLLVKPLTYMNRSGDALAALRAEAPFEPEELLICYDELALPLGRIRIRPRGSDAGHNGMWSIIDRLDTEEIPRVRVGIAPEKGTTRNASAFVLRRFRRRERAIAEESVERAADAIECVLTDDLMTAMNRFNPEPS